MHGKNSVNIKELLLKKNINVNINVSLTPYTTMGVGGTASFLVETNNSEELEQVLTLADENKTPWLLLGKGSNVVISDKGFNGLVIINKTDSWKIITEEKCRYSSNQKITSRLDNPVSDNKEDQKSLEIVIVRVDSGSSVTSLTQKLYKEGISGLEWFAGIPATVGGAIYMNMHGGNYYFGDLLYRAKIISNKESKIVDNAYFKFDYDYSILQNTKEIILWADICLSMGDVVSAKETSMEWSKKKSIQPQRSAGCVFKNLSKEEKEKLNLPSQSIGYLIDKVLGLKEYKIGGAKISAKHAAFIENTGNATAKDIFLLVKMIKKTAKEKLNLDLHLEIEFIGIF